MPLIERSKSSGAIANGDALVGDEDDLVADEDIMPKMNGSATKAEVRNRSCNLFFFTVIYFR